MGYKAKAQIAGGSSADPTKTRQWHGYLKNMAYQAEQEKLRRKRPRAGRRPK